MSRSVVVSSILSAVVAATIVFLLPRRAGEPPRTLAKPGYLSDAARADLRRYMNRHGSQLIELSWDVVLLDDEGTAATAERVAREPAVPQTADELPRRFFTLQDDMLAAAVHLGQAARSHDSAEVAQAYGRLATTCVECHRVYLRR